MNKVLAYFKKLNEEKILKQEIEVVGWQFNYAYLLISSVVPYLFEPLVRIENIAPINNGNRDKRIKPKHYITIHDTGDTAAIHTAKFWSDTVYHERLMDNNNPYKASFQYVVGNDGIYHNIPDNEVAYHAGDSTMVDYHLISTGVKASDECVLGIDKQGYYTINNQRTAILAPTIETQAGIKPATVNDINDQGILITKDSDYFYIGPTYYNPTYQLIANRGGNNNSIGIEVCINQGTNIYYTYQKTAKLVAKLLKEQHLTINDIKQHHYFSGKNCPQTMRNNHLWNHFLHLVEVECQVLKFTDEGYMINFYSDSEFVDEKGLIKTLPSDLKEIKYEIEVIKGESKERITLIKLV